MHHLHVQKYENLQNAHYGNVWKRAEIVRWNCQKIMIIVNLFWLFRRYIWTATIGHAHTYSFITKHSTNPCIKLPVPSWKTFNLQTSGSFFIDNTFTSFSTLHLSLTGNDSARYRCEAHGIAVGDKNESHVTVIVSRDVPIVDAGRKLLVGHFEKVKGLDFH